MVIRSIIEDGKNCDRFYSFFKNSSLKWKSMKSVDFVKRFWETFTEYFTSVVSQAQQILQSGNI